MNILPKELENIINNYKHQMEHKEKFQSSLEEINKMTYIEGDGQSWRSYDMTTINYRYESYYELYIHSYETIPTYINEDLDDENTTITRIYDAEGEVYINIFIVAELIDIDDVSEGYQFQ